MTKFQPMDSAPKDRWVVLLLHTSPLPQAVAGCWDNDRWVCVRRDNVLRCTPIGWMDADFSVADAE